MTEPMPHLSELLDLTHVVDHVTRLAIAGAITQSGIDPTPENVQQTMDSMRVADLNELRRDTLKVAYPVARVIAEQAWRRGALDQRQRQLAIEADPSLAASEATNPFAEGQVLL
jgi:divalent metal cation (Fe/Co/Zn/Cd) transporter